MISMAEREKGEKKGPLRYEGKKPAESRNPFLT